MHYVEKVKFTFAKFACGTITKTEEALLPKEPDFNKVLST